jgi:hypothetical protein
MLSSLGGNTSVKDVISTIFGGEKGSTVLELQGYLIKGDIEHKNVYFLIDSLPNDEVKLMYGLKEDSKLQRIFNEIRLFPNS